MLDFINLSTMKINYSLFSDSQLEHIVVLTSDLKELIRVVQPLEDKDRDYISSYEEYFTRNISRSRSSGLTPGMNFTTAKLSVNASARAHVPKKLVF